MEYNLHRRNTNPIIVDCDPGADDALGILLLLSEPAARRRLLGVTTVFGNGPLDIINVNAGRILGFAGEENISVYVGAQRPLHKPFTPSTLYCGADGLCETCLKDHPERISTQSALSFYKETLQNSADKVNIICTAGYTNIAELLLAWPEAAEHIECIVAASGYFGLSDREVRAEWNIVLDPDAAEIVYQSGIPVISTGLDVTAAVEAEDARALESRLAGTRAGDFVHGVLEYDRRTGLRERSILADGLAAAWLLDPTLGTGVWGMVTMNKEREDAELMLFHEDPQGSVYAVGTFDNARYLDMLVKGLETF